MRGKNYKNNGKKTRPIRTLSLFTGAGGLDIGFHKAGYDIKVCVEIEEKFCKTLRDNPKYFKDAEIICQDISTLEPEQIKGPIDFVIGGPPCQSFSAQGHRKGLHDERGTLFEHYVRILKHFKPKGFLFENVRGILYANKGEAWETICRSFEEIGYRINHRLISAADYGVPQLRERVFILGSRESELLFPSPTNGPDSKSKKPYVTALEAIKDVYNPREKVEPFGGKFGDLLPLVPEGDNYSFFTAERGYVPPIFGWRTKFSNFLYKIARNEPIRTLQAQPGKGSGPLHWLNRRLNVDELIRLQTFPKDYNFKCGLSLAHHQIGNSVPPHLACVLAKAIKKQLLGMSIGKDELIHNGFKFSFDARKGVLAKKTRRIREKNLEKLNGQEELIPARA